jgi:2-C-methyl-D-erythritol 4-phosphate cytidylyltransferase
MNQGNIHAILLSGGEGKRFGSALPKQFARLRGESLLQRSVRLFRYWGFIKQIVVVSHSDYLAETESELRTLLESDDRIVIGGKSRHESTLAGIGGLRPKKEDIVFIHDVARPFFRYAELDLMVQAVRRSGAASLGVASVDTLVRTLGEKNQCTEILNRESVWNVKTPQAISGSLLLERLLSSQGSEGDPEKAQAILPKNTEIEPTDLCSWCLPEGIAPEMVPTVEWNMKVTKPEDLSWAEQILEWMELEVR